MHKFDFYTEVRILRTTETESSGIADSTGIIMGTSEGQLGPSYAVSIDGISHMVTETDLVATGRGYSREDFYGDSSINVAPQRYSDDSNEDLE